MGIGEWNPNVISTLSLTNEEERNGEEGKGNTLPLVSKDNHKKKVIPFVSLVHHGN